MAKAHIVPDTVTNTRMTEAEARDWAGEQIIVRSEHPIVMVVLSSLGLIKPPPTREERFSAETGIALTPDIIKALEYPK